MAKGKMFDFITETWNIVIGCKHNCRYCWAKKLAEGRLKSFGGRYKDGFKPTLVQSELNRKFKAGAFVFVSDMGDLFGEWVPEEWIIQVIDHIKKFPKTTFLFLTKNPERYLDFLDMIPGNVMLGATVETNEKTIFISDAPQPQDRLFAMTQIKTHDKFLSIEPIMDFDFKTFFGWIKAIDPVLVAIGYDNYNNMLDEPSLAKTVKLIDTLKNMNDHIEVQVKTLRLRA